jgi:hypothetical protein
MVTYADPKSKNADPRPGVSVTQSNKGSGTTIAIVIAAIVVVIAAYMMFFSHHACGSNCRTEHHRDACS